MTLGRLVQWQAAFRSQSSSTGLGLTQEHRKKPRGTPQMSFQPRGDGISKPAAGSQSTFPQRCDVSREGCIYRARFGACFAASVRNGCSLPKRAILMSCNAAIQPRSRGTMTPTRSGGRSGGRSFSAPRPAGTRRSCRPRVVRDDFGRNPAPADGGHRTGLAYFSQTKLADGLVCSICQLAVHSGVEED